MFYAKSKLSMQVKKMSKGKQTVQVSILGKRYQVLCPQEDVAALNQAASHLSEHMQRLQSSGVITNPERIAVMAALNLAHELLTERDVSLDYKSSVEQKMRMLSASMDEVLITAPTHRNEDFDAGAR
jgi:cell division protein ZapA